MLLKNKRQTKKNLILALFLIILFLIPLCFSLSTLKDDSSKKGEKEDIDFESIKMPKLSANEIIIKTPENKTYTDPMSGYYPATYGFENDLNGVRLATGWTQWQASGATQIYEEIGGHKKVYGVYDSIGWERRTIQTFTAVPQTKGTIEFYIRTDNTLNASYYVVYNYFNPPTYNYPFYILVAGGKIRFYNGTYYEILSAAQNNKWYHVRYDFRMSGASEYLGLNPNTIKVYLDSVDKGTYKCIGTFTTVKEVHMQINTAVNNGYNAYIDALSYSWDSNYTIGDNKKEGLLLSYDSSVSLTWKGYSLDGAANKTILGNITIPMPNVGSHRIKISGNTATGTKYQSEVRHFKSGAIFINTPENKTYADAMSRYYPATYGFENDRNGDIPKDWDDFSAQNCFSRVVGEVGGHKKVLELYDNNNSLWCALNNTFSPRTSGTVEFYWRGGAAHSFMCFYNGPVQTIWTAYDIAWDDYRTYDGITYQSVLGEIPEDTWYHHKIVFDCSTHTFDWYINGILRGNDKDFRNDENQIDRIYLGSGGLSNYYTYFDAFSYSWDPNYNIGDNLEVGLLLSYENTTNLDWIGYSLDGSANITILGNTTIPMPIDGSHKIQVFGNNSIGTMYESEEKYFAISHIKVIMPEYKVYYNPMSGYYPATYGFENDAVGIKSPNGWSGIQYQSSTIKIIASSSNHNKVYELYDGDNQGAYSIHSFSSQSYGTIEYWFKVSDATKNIRVNLRQNGQASETMALGVRSGNGKLQANDGGLWIDICPTSNNIWYHIRIDFECTSNFYEGLSQYDYYIYVNGVKYGSYDFSSNNNYNNELVIESNWVQSSYYGYWDAFGFSWDPNYNIGDNKKEGLLLSFENSTNLDWIGYSLDGQANKAILGNATIPMPKGGHHTIQMFGNDSLGTNYLSEIRQFTVSPFNKISFINTTYTQPTSGYYPATYGFDNDAVGNNPEGWTSTAGSGCTIKVMESINDHNKVLLLDDANTATNAKISKTFASQVFGTIEFWYRTDNVADESFPIRIQRGSAPSDVCINMDVYVGYLRVAPLGVWSIMQSINANQWYHIRVDFECESGGYKGLSPDTFRVYVNGIEYGAYDFQNKATSIVYIEAYTQPIPIYKIYFDAIGYSWDPNYNVGDNTKEGLLLSFENSTNLDWIGYSLDGAANKTILGNATIPMPANGTYTIKLFCNDTLGNYYDSEIIHFTVSVAQTPITPITPIGPGGSGGDDDDGGDRIKTDNSSFFLIILVIIIVALIATFSYVIYRSHTKKPKLEKNKVPKPKKEKKPKPPKQRNIKKPIKGVSPGIISCPYCFNENPSNAEYCSYCGVNFKEAEEKKDELPNKAPMKYEQTKFEEEIDIKNILTKAVILNILRLKGGNPLNLEELLNKIFQNREEKELIRNEISKVPEGTFKDFLIAYEKITKELESKKPEHDFNNENYFKEGRGK